MLDLFSYFDGMSKSLLRDVHAKTNNKKGLLNNALIQSEVMSYFSDKNRAAEKFAAMEPWQRRTLNLIYHSVSRGLTFNELRLTVHVSKEKDLNKQIKQKPGPAAYIQQRFIGNTLDLPGNVTAADLSVSRVVIGITLVILSGLSFY